MRQVTLIPLAKTGKSKCYIPQIGDWGVNILGCIICSSKLTVFLEQRSRKSVRFEFSSELVCPQTNIRAIFTIWLFHIMFVLA